MKLTYENACKMMYNQIASNVENKLTSKIKGTVSCYANILRDELVVKIQTTYGRVFRVEFPELFYHISAGVSSKDFVEMALARYRMWLVNNEINERR